MPKLPHRPSAASIALLAVMFHRNGYVRWADLARRAEVGQLYRKGDELRLVADSAEELAAIRRALDDAHFRLGKAFVKGRQYRQPLYGTQEVTRFLELVGAKPRGKR